MSQSELRQVIDAETAEPGWKSLYKVGGIAALIMVVFPLAEVAISFLPGVAGLSQATVSVIDWFSLFQNHWFLALRNLGLLNIVGAAFLAPTILAIYSVLRRDHEAYAGVRHNSFLRGAGGLPCQQQGLPYAFAERPIRKCHHGRAEGSFSRGRASDAGRGPKPRWYSPYRIRMLGNLRGHAERQGLQQSGRLCGNPGECAANRR